MLRALWYLALVTAISFFLAWLADNPGHVSLDWQGYRVDMSVSILFSVIFIFSIVTAIFYRLWLFVRRAPKKILGKLKNQKRERGYKALTQGMVAVAAGDRDEAFRLVKRAKVLLDERPLTMLLSAQTAQLNGDEKAAKEFFTLMAKESETQFLGFRGLITQAMKEDDFEVALQLTRRAYALKPKSDWVARSLFDLQIKQGHWLDAQTTSDELAKNGLIKKQVNRERKAVLSYQLGLKAIDRDNPVEAQHQFKKSIDFDPTFVPGVLAFVSQLIKRRHYLKAQKIIEKTWQTSPHPNLLTSYWETVKTKNPMDRMRASESLAKNNPEHHESYLAIIAAALEAKLWGEARKYLKKISNENLEKINSRVCRFWAELEKAEKGDVDKTHIWLTRASVAGPSEAWRCNSCGNTVNEWEAVCKNCERFNSFSWAYPLGTVGRIGSHAAMPNILEKFREVEAS